MSMNGFYKFHLSHFNFFSSLLSSVHVSLTTMNVGMPIALQNLIRIIFLVLFFKHLWIVPQMIPIAQN